MAIVRRQVPWTRSARTKVSKNDHSKAPAKLLNACGAEDGSTESIITCGGERIDGRWYPQRTCCDGLRV